MFYSPYPPKHPLAPLVDAIRDAHEGLEVEPFHYEPVVRSRAILAHADTAAMMWEACRQRAVSFDPETMTVRAFGSVLAMAFEAADGTYRWVLRPPRMGWGSYPLMDQANPFRTTAYDIPDHVRVAGAVLNAVYGEEDDGTPRSALGIFAGAVVAYTPHGVMELPPGRVVALIPDTHGRGGVLEEFRRRWQPKPRTRQVARVTGDPAMVQPAPLIRDDDDLDLFLAGKMVAPPLRPVPPVRGRGNYGKDRMLAWEYEQQLYEWALEDWEAQYGFDPRPSSAPSPKSEKRLRVEREMELARERIRAAEREQRRERERLARNWQPAR